MESHSRREMSLRGRRGVHIMEGIFRGVSQIGQVGLGGWGLEVGAEDKNLQISNL